MSDEAFLSIGETYSVRLVLKAITGAKGIGCGRLGFLLEITPRSQVVEGCDLTLSGEVSVSGGGYLSALQPITASTLMNGGHRTEWMYAELDHYRLHALEEMRASNGIKFSLRLEGQAIYGPENMRTSVSTNVSDFEVNQSAWLDLLTQLGWAQQLLLELPIPDPATHPELSAATKHLLDARRSFDTGEFRQAGMECRYALDVLLKEEEPNGGTYIEVVNRIKTVPKDKLDKGARFHLVQMAAKAAADLAAHPEVDQLSRTDTAALIAVVAGLVKQAG